MPSDLYAAAQRKQTGRRVWSEKERQKFIAQAAIRRAKVAKKRAQTGCSCGCVKTKQVPQEFADGSMHVKLVCDKCGKYVKWLR